MQCNIVQYNAMEYCTAQCNRAQCNTMQYNTVLRTAIQYSAVGRCTASRETVRCACSQQGDCVGIRCMLGVWGRHEWPVQSYYRADNKGLQSGLGQPTVTLSFVATVQLNSVHESGRREMQTDRQTQADTQTGTQTRRQKKGEGSTTASLNAGHKYNLSIP